MGSPSSIFIFKFLQLFQGFGNTEKSLYKPESIPNQKSNRISYRGLITVVILIFLCGCRYKPNDKLVDYNQLDQLNLKLTLEIGSIEESTLGSLGSLLLVSDGKMLVSDLGKNTIEQYDATGEHMGTIASKGGGPGELPSTFFMHKGNNDTLIVWHGDGSRRVDFFSKNENDMYRFVRSSSRNSLKDRVPTILGPHPDTTYFAKTREISDNMRQWIADHSNHYWSPVVTMDNSFNHVLQDSLHMLKKATPLVNISSGGAMRIYGIPPYQSQDIFRLIGNGRYLVGRPDSSSLYIYGRDHTLRREIPLHVTKRPVKQADLDYQFDLMSAEDSIRREMEARIPDTKPPFLNIWVSEKYIWMHTDTSQEGKQIVLMTLQGEVVGVFHISAFDEIQQVDNNHIYALHKNPESGHRIKIYKVVI